MTKNKIDKAVQKGMVNDLLDEGDQEKPAPRPSYSGTGSSYSSNQYWDGGSYHGGGRQSSLLDDDGPDPMDSSYGRGKPSTSTTNYTGRSTTGIQAHHARQADRTKGMFEVRAKKIGTFLASLDSTKETRIVITQQECDELVGTVSREVGDLLEQAGVVWTTKAMLDFKDSVQAVFATAMYQSVGRKYKPIIVLDPNNPEHTRATLPGEDAIDAAIMEDGWRAMVECPPEEHIDLLLESGNVCDDVVMRITGNGRVWTIDGMVAVMPALPTGWRPTRYKGPTVAQLQAEQREARAKDADYANHQSDADKEKALLEASEWQAIGMIANDTIVDVRFPDESVIEEVTLTRSGQWVDMSGNTLEWPTEPVWFRIVEGA